MYDRFLIKDCYGNIYYTTRFSDLIKVEIIDILAHERTFNNGETFIVLED